MERKVGWLNKNFSRKVAANNGPLALDLARRPEIKKEYFCLSTKKKVFGEKGFKPSIKLKNPFQREFNSFEIFSHHSFLKFFNNKKIQKVPQIELFEVLKWKKSIFACPQKKVFLWKRFQPFLPSVFHFYFLFLSTMKCLYCNSEIQNSSIHYCFKCNIPLHGSCLLKEKTCPAKMSPPTVSPNQNPDFIKLNPTIPTQFVFKKKGVHYQHFFSEE